MQKFLSFQYNLIYWQFFIDLSLVDIALLQKEKLLFKNLYNLLCNNNPNSLVRYAETK